MEFNKKNIQKIMRNGDVPTNGASSYSYNKSGANGNTTYFHIKYSDSANGSDMNDTGGAYIGQYVDFTAEDSIDPTKYTWTLIKGDKGDQGIAGHTTYFHIKYSNSPHGSNMNVTGGAYIGTYVDFTAEDSIDPRKYIWVLVKGVQGDQGIAGRNGINGQTSYLHIAYADSPNGRMNFNQTSGNYIGQYVDFTQTDSIDTTRYTWTLIKGVQGDQGDQGIKGLNGSNGQTSYLHIAYADSPDGKKNFNQTSGTYIGQYVDFTKDDSTDPTKYNWTLIKGDQGIEGCVIRDGEWVEGTSYLNQSKVEQDGIRYIDVALIADSNSSTGWDAYLCRQDHIASESNKPGTEGGNTYWEKFSTNVTAIFTSLIIAKNAKIKFLQGNQLLLMDSNGDIVGGLSGFRTDSNDVRLWIGGSEPSKAPYRVMEDGSVVATKMLIMGDSEIRNCLVSGEITASVIGYKASTVKDGLVNGCLIVGGGNYILPTLSAGKCVEYTLFNPMMHVGKFAHISGQGEYDRFMPSDSNAVFDDTASNNVTLMGFHKIVGIGGYTTSGGTLWVIN